MSISLIIFSKNRPLQLDLCLSSLANFRADLSATVIYSCDNEYSDAYKTVKHEHRYNADFWEQGSSLFKDVYSRLVSHREDYMCFLTDDCIVYQETPELSEGVLKELFSFELLSCFSLRLGENTNKRDLAGTVMDDPLRYAEGLQIFRNNRGMICYDRTQHLHGGYWNYPLSVDGHIYRCSDMVEWMDELCHIEKIKDWKQTPNELEKALQRFCNIAPPFVAFDQKSSVVNSPNNRVQDTIENRNGDYFNFTCDHLLDLYTSGKRIELQKLKDRNAFNVNCPHTEIDILQG